MTHGGGGGGQEEEDPLTHLYPESVRGLPDVPKGQLPPHLNLQKTRVVCRPDAPIHTNNITYSGAYASMGVDNSITLQDFRDIFRIEVIRLSKEDMEFDMIGIDASIANAFRRILISEKVLIANNTSVIQDEVLSHRLGLIPIKADPKQFEYLSANDTANEKNTIVFKLHVRCAKKDSRHTVYSSELKWLPTGSEFLKESQKPDSKPSTYTNFNCSQDSVPEFSSNPICPSDDKIILAKLGAGQVILLEDVEDGQAEELVKKCPVNVFDIEDIGNGSKKAMVARPRACTLCRECIRGEFWDKRVALRFRLNDLHDFHLKYMEHGHPLNLCYRFKYDENGLKRAFQVPQLAKFLVCSLTSPRVTIESTGALPPEDLFTEAVKILEDKCERVITELS